MSNKIGSWKKYKWSFLFKKILYFYWSEKKVSEVIEISNLPVKEKLAKKWMRLLLKL